VLHEYFLPMWGMPVGKLWDLEKLSEVYRSLQRWSFFLTSAPLNIASGIGSPSNAIALFEEWTAFDNSGELQNSVDIQLMDHCYGPDCVQTAQFQIMLQKTNNRFFSGR
jgi:hypothetical protein